MRHARLTNCPRYMPQRTAICCFDLPPDAKKRLADRKEVFCLRRNDLQVLCKDLCNIHKMADKAKKHKTVNIKDKKMRRAQFAPAALQYSIQAHKIKCGMSLNKNEEQTKVCSSHCCNFISYQSALKVSALSDVTVVPA